MKIIAPFAIVALVLFALPFLLGATETVPLNSTNSADQVCLECHDVLSLEKVGNVHHRIRPFEVMGNKTGCEACHGSGQEHMEEGNPEKIFSFKRAGQEEASQACLNCHQSLQAADWKLGDHAFNDVSCTDCHSIHDEQGLLTPEPQLCMDCHTEIKMKSNFPSHHPLREGKMTCSSCHDHHGSLIQNLKTTERLNDLCFKCHADKQGPFIFEHAPVLEDCAICHDAHGSVANNLLKQNEPFLCLQCHESHFHAGRIGLEHPRTLPVGASSQNPFGTSGWRAAFLTKCSQCHFKVHGTDLPSQTVTGGGRGIIR
jgi:DmsE family decaheme c-type cytochrome